MEVTVAFRNMRPREALITLVKGLLDARARAARGPATRLQISIRKTYSVHLSSALSRQSWAVVDEDPERAVRSAFERFEQAAADVSGICDAHASAREPRQSVFAKVGESLGVSKLAVLATGEPTTAES
jgi:hypothetical protein